ncbi:aminotransferase class V-fold PLP-dependent enzyme [Mesomycoplasma ovipneumoniae]|uniref:cysteine desulfurase n=1 Tax=Mesomycoplasma ovipneumoniae TaxID=29562 RepID=UPI00311B3F68
MTNYKQFFPFLNKVTYLDSAAMTQKPISVVEKINHFYTNCAVNTHSSNSKIAFENLQILNQTREKIAKLIDGFAEEIIFTSGTTESINLFANMIKKFIRRGDEILLSPLNHSSNLLVWVKIAQKVGAKIVYSTKIIDKISTKTAVIALTQANNSILVDLDLAKIWEKAIKNGAFVINDATQSINFQKVSMNFCHALAFSSNKFYGPTGLGVLAIKKYLMGSLEPVKFGGGIIRKFDNKNLLFYNDYRKFEAGTLNFAAIWGLNAAIDFINEIGIETIYKKIRVLADYLYEKLEKIDDIEIFSKKGDHIIIFNIKGFSAQDVASYLGNNDIYVRSGNFCVPLLKKVLKNDSFIRVSLGFYNDFADIDDLITNLEEKRFLDFV